MQNFERDRQRGYAQSVGSRIVLDRRDAMMSDAQMRYERRTNALCARTRCADA